MNALIYCESSNLFIRKPNGLEYQFENVDRPALGFDFDVLVYDDVYEVKILNWNNDRCFEDQELIQLNDDEMEMVEMYISNSEPPEGVTLSNQFISRLRDYVKEQIGITTDNYGFDDLVEVTYAGRDSSNHPKRSNARRVLEFADAVNCVFYDLADEISRTREDHLKHIDEYLAVIPQGPILPDHD